MKRKPALPPPAAAAIRRGAVVAGRPGAGLRLKTGGWASVNRWGG
jgi:hypothetical protein